MASLGNADLDVGRNAAVTAQQQTKGTTHAGINNKSSAVQGLELSEVWPSKSFSHPSVPAVLEQ